MVLNQDTSQDFKSVQIFKFDGNKNRTKLPTHIVDTSSVHKTREIELEKVDSENSENVEVNFH